jgi:hypothetical protein
MVTGGCDYDSFLRIDHVRTMAIAQQLTVCPTQCAHIFAPSTNQDISGENQGGQKVENALRFFEVSLLETTTDFVHDTA